jgi:hypothetical protein
MAENANEEAITVGAAMTRRMIFISASSGMCEKIVHQITKRKHTAIVMEVEDAEWVVTALRKEIRSMKKRETTND